MRRLLLAVLVAATPLAAQQEDDTLYVRNNFVKREARIPMRDGVHLFTTIYVPKDTAQRYPDARAIQYALDRREQRLRQKPWLAFALVAPRPVRFVEPSERVRSEMADLRAWYETLGRKFDPLSK